MSEPIDTTDPATYSLASAEAGSDLRHAAELSPAPAGVPIAGGDLLYDDFSSEAFAKTPLWLVGDVAGQVVDLWMHGRLDEAKAYQALAALVVVEADGTQWTLGATSRRWFKRLPGGGWRLARPPADTSPLAEPAERAVEAALWLLGVNPETVSIEAGADTPAGSANGSDSDLLDGLLEGYGG